MLPLIATGQDKEISTHVWDRPDGDHLLYNALKLALARPH